VTSERRSGAGWVRASLAIASSGILKSTRTPATIIQSLFFPTFFLIIYSGLFSALVRLDGFPTDRVENWYVPFMMLQGAAFAGVAAGFVVGAHIESGYFDRQLLYPVRRGALLVGTMLIALARGLFVSLVVLLVGIALGARSTGGVLGILLLFLGCAGICITSSGFSLGLIYRAKSLQVAPLFPIGIFITLFVSTAQVPISISTGWLQRAARVNPITNVLRLGRQAFLDGGVSWANTWGGLVALAAMCAVLSWFAWTGLRKYVP
jgi:ABC-2 type transport system permease protein